MVTHVLRCPLAVSCHWFVLPCLLLAQDAWNGEQGLSRGVNGNHTTKSSSGLWKLIPIPAGFIMDRELYEIMWISLNLSLKTCCSSFCPLSASVCISAAFIANASLCLCFHIFVVTVLQPLSAWFQSKSPKPGLRLEMEMNIPARGQTKAIFPLILFTWREVLPYICVKFQILCRIWIMGREGLRSPSGRSVAAYWGLESPKICWRAPHRRWDPMGQLPWGRGATFPSHVPIRATTRL